MGISPCRKLFKTEGFEGAKRLVLVRRRRTESRSRSTSASSVQAIMWNVYILNCDKKTFYVGITNNIDSRIIEYKNKKSLFTKKFSDLELIYKESFNNKIKAAKREKQLKGWSRIKKQNLINSLQ